MNRGVLIQKFFDSYPSDVVMENSEEMKDRLKAMERAIIDLRTQAINDRSIQDLRDTHTLEHEFTLLCMLHAQRKSRLVQA